MKIGFGKLGAVLAAVLPFALSRNAETDPVPLADVEREKRQIAKHAKSKPAAIKPKQVNGRKQWYTPDSPEVKAMSKKK